MDITGRDLVVTLPRNITDALLEHRPFGIQFNDPELERLRLKIVSNDYFINQYNQPNSDENWTLYTLMYLLNSIEEIDSKEWQYRPASVGSVESPMFTCWVPTVGDAPDQYGRKRIGFRNGKIFTYDFVYEAIIGKIVHQCSHLCSNPGCIKTIPLGGRRWPYQHVKERMWWTSVPTNAQ